MTVLYYAYNFNIAKAFEGKLSYITHQQEKKEFQAYEKLSIMDLEQFAIMCFDNGDYALSIEFVKNILKLLPQLRASDFKNFKEARGLSKRVNIMKENLIKLNNGYLEKHQTFVNNNYRVLTYMVDKKLNRKKKQPEYIENQTIYDPKWDLENNRGPEWLFMQTCQLGRTELGKLNMPLQLQLVYKCHYLHHKNPYLKLGPFKEEMIANIPYLVIFHDILSDKEIGKPYSL